MNNFSVIDTVGSLVKYFSQGELENIARELLESSSNLVGGKNPYEYASSLLDVVGRRSSIQDLIRVAKKQNNKFTICDIQEIPLNQGYSGWLVPFQGNIPEVRTAQEITFRSIPFLQKGIKVSESVGRICTTSGGQGTGFLISKSYVMTNHHVLPDQEIAQKAFIEFDYLDDIQKLRKVFKVKNYIWSNERLDVAVIEIDGNPDLPHVIFNVQEIFVGRKAFIIGHPDGRAKQVSIGNNQIRYVNNPVIHYLTDTLQGSSGSPVFDENWSVIAIHHEGGVFQQYPGPIPFYGNEGIQAIAIQKEWKDFVKITEFRT